MNYDNINSLYHDLVMSLKVRGHDTGDTKELLNVMFSLDDINNNVITTRNISYKYALAELIWYFSGDNSVKFIGQFANLWKKITDDGITNNSAYGFILKEKFGFDQIEKIIELLKKDKNSRRAVLNINTPNERVIETKDEPCTISIQFFIRDNKLYCTTVMRSNDIWFGLPYDAIFFTELQKYVAHRLSCEYGAWTHFVGSMHVYKRDLDKIKRLTEDETKYKFNIDKIVENAEHLNIVLDNENILRTCLDLKLIGEYE